MERFRGIHNRSFVMKLVATEEQMDISHLPRKDRTAHLYWRFRGFDKTLIYTDLFVGPALIIASSLVLAIRTAKWSATHSDGLSTADWDKEVEHCARVAKVVLSHLASRCPELFQMKDVPWFVATDEDTPK
jgi:hypothetical protein